MVTLFSEFVKHGIDKTREVVIKTTGFELINLVNKI